MLIPIATLPERLGAEGTIVGLLARVDTLMVLQGIGTIKTLTAFIALVTPLATMYEPVLIKNRAGEKALATDQTMIRPFARVALAYMIIEVWAYGEFAAAVLLLANEWFHTCEPQ